MRVKVILLICLLLCGCASSSTRYLTPEEEDTMRRACELSGCVIVPAPLWESVKKLLGIQDI